MDEFCGVDGATYRSVSYCIVPCRVAVRTLDTDEHFIRASQQSAVSQNVPERPRANFAAALNVRQNAIRGFTSAILFTIAVLAVFVFLPGTTQPTPYYVGLGFVLASSLGALVTTILTLVSAYRLAKEEDLA